MGAVREPLVDPEMRIRFSRLNMKNERDFKRSQRLEPALASLLPLNGKIQST
jgi:hypothetical protein